MIVLYLSYLINFGATPLWGLNSGQAEVASQEGAQSRGYGAHLVTLIPGDSILRKRQ
jgi:hypothetical protein